MTLNHFFYGAIPNDKHNDGRIIFSNKSVNHLGTQQILKNLLVVQLEESSNGKQYEIIRFSQDFNSFLYFRNYPTSDPKLRFKTSFHVFLIDQKSFASINFDPLSIRKYFVKEITTSGIVGYNNRIWAISNQEKINHDIPIAFPSIQHAFQEKSYNSPKKVKAALISSSPYEFLKELDPYKRNFIFQRGVLINDSADNLNLKSVNGEIDFIFLKQESSLPDGFKYYSAADLKEINPDDFVISSNREISKPVDNSNSPKKPVNSEKKNNLEPQNINEADSTVNKLNDLSNTRLNVSPKPKNNKESNDSESNPIGLEINVNTEKEDFTKVQNDNQESNTAKNTNSFGINVDSEQTKNIPKSQTINFQDIQKPNNSKVKIAISVFTTFTLTFLLLIALLIALYELKISLPWMKNRVITIDSNGLHSHTTDEQNKEINKLNSEISELEKDNIEISKNLQYSMKVLKDLKTEIKSLTEKNNNLNDRLTQELEVLNKKINKSSKSMPQAKQP
ncbi:hypothetical protein Q0590_28295 [Rhodocytophaga aerolata]|uniref:Uncharacterized protein n=1 Tax=Rhodocytophaga aerolata TaxID=455078 RepID=A0ABT8RE24_9BACT|nr:hypothetical protein [Rhodocytophaga aerolata]MDO1450214.1 hypothetical protein [Rhodocytophaga aerolata]